MIAAATVREQEEAIKLQTALERITLAKNSREFVRESWPVIEPATEYLDNWHIDAMCEYLDAVRLGQILNLIINIPPRYMKSTVVTICFPVYWWASEPHERFIFTSYSDALAKEHSLKRRDIILSEWYQDRWGDRVQLADDQNEKREFKNTAAGVMVAVPIGGSITGKGGNCIIIDDPINPDEAESPAERVAAIRFIEGTLSTRLNDKKRGRKVMVMQRLHEKDPTGHELAKGGWEHLKLPAVAEKKTIIVLPITGRRIVREQDSILWPEREGKKELDIQRIAMTESRFAGQYQQEPAPSEGALIKREWWRVYRQAELPTEWDYVIDSWDCSFKDAATSDYVVGTKWGKRGAKIYLLQVVRARMGLAETCLALQGLVAQSPSPNEVLVEDKANGSAVVEVMQKLYSFVMAVEPKGGKVARVNAASPCIKAGSVYVPHVDECSWVAAFIEECARFTGKDGETDDQVDSMSQAIIRFLLNGGGIYEWLKQKFETEQGEERAAELDEVGKVQAVTKSWSKSIEVVKNGGQIICGKDDYVDGLRREMSRFIAHCVANDDSIHMTIMLTEQKRLDALFKVNV